jgi:hypothetical protein
MSRARRLGGRERWRWEGINERIGQLTALKRRGRKKAIGLSHVSRSREEGTWDEP